MSIAANEKGQALMLRVNGPHVKDSAKWKWRKLQPTNMHMLDLCALWSEPGRTPLLAGCQGSLFEWHYPFTTPLHSRATGAFHPKAIWSANSKDIWVLAHGRPPPALYHFDGKKLKPMTKGLPERCEYRAIAGSAANDVWLVGEDGCIAHFDGTEWSEVPSGFDERLSGVWAAEPAHAWAVGVGGTILEWNGQAWRRQESDTLQDLLAISGSSERDVWVVGEAGTVLHQTLSAP